MAIVLTVKPGPPEPTPDPVITTYSTPWLAHDTPVDRHFDTATLPVFFHMMVATNLRRSINNVNLNDGVSGTENTTFMPRGVANDGGLDTRVFGGRYRHRALGRTPYGTTVADSEGSTGGNYRDQDWQWWLDQAHKLGLRDMGLDILSASGSNAGDNRRVVRAAIRLGGKIKMLLMPDGSTLKNAGSGTAGAAAAGAHVRDLIAMDPSVFTKHTDGRYLISAYGPETVTAAGTANKQATIDWWVTFIQTVESGGFPVAFWPCFTRAWKTASENTYAAFVDSHAFDSWLVGVGRWGTSDPVGVAAGAADITTSQTTDGLPHMYAVRVTEDFRPYAQVWWEAGGWELYAEGIKAALERKPKSLQLPTINDWGECTAAAPNQNHGWVNFDVLRYDICRTRLNWTPPILRDTLYLTHRQQMSPTGGTTTYTAPAPFDANVFQRRGSTSDRDQVGVRAMLTAPAFVEISTDGGASWAATACPAGVTHVYAPLAITPANGIRCRVVRNGSVVADTTIVSPWAVEATRDVFDLTSRRMSSREHLRPAA